MRYLLLIYGPEADEQPPDDQIQAEMAAYNAFTQEVRDGRTITTDGPFAETKEALGGFYLVKARDLDEAIEVAAKIPGAKRGSIEIRPVWEFGADESTAAEAVGSAG